VTSLELAHFPCTLLLDAYAPYPTSSWPIEDGGACFSQQMGWPQEAVTTYKVVSRVERERVVLSQ